MKICVTESANESKPARNYHFIRKILEVLKNDRMLDRTCEQYIHALKTKYISLAKVVAQSNKNCAMSNKFNQKKSTHVDQYSLSSSSMKDLILSSNLPLTEMDIILKWADQSKCILQDDNNS